MRIASMKCYIPNNELILKNLKYCKLKNKYHYFLIINNIYAISYVPITLKYVIDKYYNQDIRKPLDNIKINIFDTMYTLLGYFFMCFFKSVIVDTWKMSNEYEIIEEYTYDYTEKKDKIFIDNIIDKTKQKFTHYNILFFIGIFCVADCIGFSRYIINKCKKKK